MAAGASDLHRSCGDPLRDCDWTAQWGGAARTIRPAVRANSNSNSHSCTFTCARLAATAVRPDELLQPREAANGRRDGVSACARGFAEGLCAGDVLYYYYYYYFAAARLTRRPLAIGAGHTIRTWPAGRHATGVWPAGCELHCRRGTLARRAELGRAARRRSAARL